MNKTDLLLNPLEQFLSWYEAAKQQEQDADAMTLATVDEQQQPHARIVLYKGLMQEQGFLFYTNYTSDKANQIQAIKRVATVFYWPKTYRQVRIEGLAKKIDYDQSNSYFQSRPRASQIAALASHQSQVLPSREQLDNQFSTLEQAYEGKTITCPKFWGGYVIEPQRIEFWQGRENRMHDRFCYQKNGDSWVIERLSP